MSKTTKTREQWLEQATRAIGSRVLRNTEYTMPEHWKVTCGFPRGSSRFIGQCFPPELSADKKTTHMFVSPVLGEDIVVLLATLVHEVGHAVVGCEAKHGKPFRDFMRSVGLEGKPKSTYANEALAATLADIAQRLGEYPHPVIHPIQKTTKSGGGWVRYESIPLPGYKVVISPKALDEHGAPLDPTGMAMVPDGEADAIRAAHSDEDEADELLEAA